MRFHCGDPVELRVTVHEEKFVGEWVFEENVGRWWYVPSYVGEETHEAVWRTTTVLAGRSHVPHVNGTLTLRIYIYIYIYSDFRNDDKYKQVILLIEHTASLAKPARTLTLATQTNKLLEHFTLLQAITGRFTWPCAGVLLSSALLRRRHFYTKQHVQNFLALVESMQKCFRGESRPVCSHGE